MAIYSTGELSIEDIDEMNIPVNSFITGPKESTGRYTWIASNFMPRKERCGDGWSIEADTKEELIRWVNLKVLPLYDAAVKNLMEFGENYYWEAKDGGR